uniref:P23 n=1 Tax=Jasmine virus A TaxID=3080342 RepID=A0AA96WRJ5_9VIRU|nr:p23 [Jasmine virus A]
MDALKALVLEIYGIKAKILSSDCRIDSINFHKAYETFRNFDQWRDARTDNEVTQCLQFVVRDLDIINTLRLARIDTELPTLLLSRRHVSVDTDGFMNDVYLLRTLVHNFQELAVLPLSILVGAFRGRCEAGKDDFAEFWYNCQGLIDTQWHSLRFKKEAIVLAMDTRDLSFLENFSSFGRFSGHFVTEQFYELNQYCNPF